MLRILQQVVSDATNDLFSTLNNLFLLRVEEEEEENLFI